MILIRPKILQHLQMKLLVLFKEILANQTTKKKVEILKTVTEAARKYADNNVGMVRFENEAILIVGKE